MDNNPKGTAMSVKILTGDSTQLLKTLDANTVDAVVTDPPYGLSFMNKKWDYDVPSTELWREVFRVMKPGAHLLAFGGTRTYHRLVVAIEDAGFEIRDQIQWIYGSGFPKSLDVSKAIDKAAGAEREVIAEVPHTTGIQRNNSLERDELKGGDSRQGKLANEMMKITAPATDLAKQWQGWGTALKPANEPVVLARKPLEKGLTVAENVQKWGTGALNIDGTRIGTNDTLSIGAGKSKTFKQASLGTNPGEQHALGRWPANVLFDEEAAAMLDEQSGFTKACNRKPSTAGHQDSYVGGQIKKPVMRKDHSSDSGGASRFFYVAKASKRERNAGLEGMPEQILATSTGQTRPNNPARLGADPHAVQAPVANYHPTVKPIKLMEYLCKLITPPGGIVLDPFLGSGSTGVAAMNEKYRFIGCELDPQYVEIAIKRIKHAKEAAILSEQIQNLKSSGEYF